MEVKFEENIIISGMIKCRTGMLIGGVDEGLDIGGIDKTFVRDPVTGKPMIPGSSLKGKMRSLIELRDKKYSSNGAPHGHSREGCKDENCDICVVFGSTSDTKRGPTRLIVRDALMDGETMGERKTENVINRLTGKAEHPRTFERVPAGSTFSFEMVFGIYNPEDKRRLRMVFEAMSFLEDSYLGSSGTRGYGRIEFKDVTVRCKTKDDYLNGRSGRELDVSGRKALSARELLENFESLKC